MGLLEILAIVLVVCIIWRAVSGGMDIRTMLLALCIVLVAWYLLSGGHFRLL